MFLILITGLLFTHLLQIDCAEANSKTSQDDVCNMKFVTEEGDPAEVKCSCISISADCSNLRIKTLPHLLVFPRGVVSANFRGNDIQEISNDTFYSGKEIVEIDLSHNQIDFISVEAFSFFRNLQRLQLSHNRIWNLPWSAFQALPQLRSLDLSFNELENIFPDAFQKLELLEELNLKANPLHSMEPHHFEHLPNLKFLDLESVMLIELPDRLFAFIPKLRRLSLANNLMTEVPSVALRPLSELRNLDLSGNPIETIDSEAFPGLKRLNVLRLDRMPVLESIGSHAFADLNRLVELQCSYNFLLSEIHEDAFVSKKDGTKVRVNQLFLRQNKLHKLSPHLLTWGPDIDLDLMGNPWDCHCQTQWMIHLRAKSKFQDHIWCVTPKYLKGRSLDSLKDEELPCGMSFTEIVTITTGSLLGLTLLISLIALVLHRKRFIAYTKANYKPYSRTNDEDVVYEKRSTPPKVAFDRNEQEFM